MKLQRTFLLCLAAILLTGFALSETWISGGFVLELPGGAALVSSGELDAEIETGGFTVSVSRFPFEEYGISREMLEPAGYGDPKSVLRALTEKVLNDPSVTGSDPSYASLGNGCVAARFDLTSSETHVCALVTDGASGALLLFTQADEENSEDARAVLDTLLSSLSLNV